MVFDSRFHEAQEKRVRVDDRTVVFRVVLHAHKPLQARNLDNLNQVRFRILARTHHAGGLELALILVVELETVAMTLLDVLLTIA